MKNKVAFYALGCKVNSYEIDAIWKIFEQKNYAKVDFDEVADVYVINTCTVTNTGDKKSRQIIRQAIRRNTDAIICVMGCYSQTSPNEISEIEGVDIIIGTQDRKKIIDYIEEYKRDRIQINAVSNVMKNREFETLKIDNFSSRTRAYVKIQEGCNNFCTFCIIPWARGLMRSRDPLDIIDEINSLTEAGYKEVVLTGIHTAGYGQDLEDFDFADLLDAIGNKCSKIARVRISSIEASQVNDKVIETFKRFNNIYTNHLHIPIQSGSSEILKKMRRHYNVEEFIQYVDRLKDIFPNLAITTDIIVGFPGETEDNFKESIETCKKVGFSEMHVFPYSVRQGTPASRMDDQIDHAVKKERVHTLIDLSTDMAKDYAKRFLNNELEVIVEKRNRADKLEGHAGNYIKIVFDGSDDLIGKMVKVKITNADYPTCEGTISA